MRNSTLILVLLILGLVVFVIGGLRIWFDGNDPISNPHPPSEFQAGPSAPHPESPPSTPTSRGNAPARSLQPPPEIAPEVPAPDAPPPVDWDATLVELLDSTQEDVVRARRLIELMPRVPESGRLEAFEVLTELVPDEHYGLLTPLLTNGLTSLDGLDVLMTDLLNRPDATQMPLFLEIARKPEHPRHMEAREYLEVYLEADHGTDWAKWEQAIRMYLAETPDF